MNLTTQQINTLTQLSNYEDRLNWVKENVKWEDIDFLFSEYSFTPDSVENTKILVKWYEPYFDKHIAHGECKKPMFLEKVNIDIRPLQNDSEKREHLEKRIKVFEGFFEERKLEQTFYSGYFYDEETKYIEFFDVLQCSDHKYILGFLRYFMDGCHTKNAILWLKERLELYPTTVTKKANIVKKGISSPKLTHKQQIVLLDKLGFLHSENFANLTMQQKANILGNLLNRDLQDTREMLTYYGGKINEEHPKTTKNIEQVNILLEENKFKL